MSDATLRRQDAGQQLGIFDNGRLMAPAPDAADSAYALRNELAAAHGGSPEVLVRCPNHPAAAAVDCLDCEPV